MSLKDEQLAELATRYNVAQFLSFDTRMEPRFRVTSTNDTRPGTTSEALEEVRTLIHESGSVNVRTFTDRESKSLDFVYGITSVRDVSNLLQQFSNRGLYTIVNETIDVHDGGVSGVALGGVTEFAPDATPRVVESHDDSIVRLPTHTAIKVLSKVYGAVPDLPLSPKLRIEFSVHPMRVGHRRGHTLCWEAFPTSGGALSVVPAWPNAFSRMIGDKVFGLVLADSLGLPVPYARVINRRIAPFDFGTPTGTRESWLRTSPSTPVAGLFTTQRGWTDPFKLLQKEDPRAQVASVISQDGVDGAFSGAAATQKNSKPVIEGVRGYGDKFMLGGHTGSLPRRVIADVHSLLQQAEDHVGSATIEWVHDGERAWLLQWHRRLIDTVAAGVLNPGDADRWIEFDPDLGLEQLRQVVQQAVGSGSGLLITRPVGVTSHVGDVIRSSGVPARLAT